MNNGALWRRTISHVNIDGAYILYACDQTGEVMWIPSCDFFVANRSQEAPTRSIMDYLVNQRRTDERPVGYGFHWLRSMNQSVNAHVQRRGNCLGSVRTHGCTLAARPLRRHDPLAHPESHPSETGSRRMMSRRKRRERLMAARLPQHQTLPSSTNTTTPTDSTAQSILRMVFNNSDPNISGVAELHLSDEEDQSLTWCISFYPQMNSTIPPSLNTHGAVHSANHTLTSGALRQKLLRPILSVQSMQQ